MRKIIASQLITVDGMFEAPNGEFVRAHALDNDVVLLRYARDRA